MDNKTKVLGLACLLGAQWACAPVGSDQADEVETVQGAIKVNTDSAGNWQTYFQLNAWQAQQQISYCVAGVGPNPPQFPDSSFQTVIANAYAAVGAPWNRTGDLLITHGLDTGCGTTSSTTTVNVVYDNQWTSTNPDKDHPGPGQALTDTGYPNSPAPRTVRIGVRPSPSPPQEGYDWQAIHEFGHVLGFQDQCSAVGTYVADIFPDPMTIMENGCSPPPPPPTLPPPYIMSDLDRVGVLKAYGLPSSSLGAPSGITLAGNPAISTWGSNHFDVFARGNNDNHLYWKKTDDNGATWTAWQSLGGSIASAPVAVSWGPNRVDVFARGTANDLQHIFFTGAWSAWDPPLATNITASPGVSSWASGRLDVFYRSTAAELHHKWYDNSTGWSPADDDWGGVIVGSPSAVSWAPNRIDVVTRNSSNHVVHFFWAGAPGGWDDLGVISAQDPTISSWGTGRLDFFAMMADQTINHTSYDSGWAGGGTIPPQWDNLKGHVSSTPAAVSLRTLTGQINLAVLGYAGDVRFTYRDPMPGMPAPGLYRAAPPRFQINCGDNGAFPPFIADTYASGGSPKTRPDDITIDATAVDPAPKDVYKSQRYGSSFTYTIPGFAANSAHVIRLHFAETNSLNNYNGARLFSVTVNGKPEIDSLDIYKRVGLFKAYIWEIAQPANSSGQYVIKFTASANAATVSGIEII